MSRISETGYTGTQISVINALAHNIAAKGSRQRAFGVGNRVIETDAYWTPGSPE